MISIRVMQRSSVALVSIRATPRSSFDDALREFKQIIPACAAAFDGDLKAWVVSNSQGAALGVFIVTMRERYGATISYPNDVTEPRSKLSVEEACRTLYLLPSAPELVVKAAYKALAQIHHPDLGGDERTMQQLNAAYDYLSRRLAA